jgi:hypothetical protein
VCDRTSVVNVSWKDAGLAQNSKTSTIAVYSLCRLSNFRGHMYVLFNIDGEVKGELFF